ADAISLQGGVTSGGTVLFITAAGGVNQGTAVHPLTAQTIALNGTGSFSLVNSGNDAIGTFGANVVGSIIFQDKNDLTVSSSLGISTGGSGLALYAGGNFTVQANDPSQVLINAPGAVVQIIPGFATASTVVFNAEVIAQSVTIGSDSGLIENGQPDKFRIRPSEHTPINVVGFNPVNVLPGDSIFPLLNDPNIVNATITKTQQADGFSGVYTIMYANNTTTTISFRQIESFEGISFQGLVVQTGVNQYSIRLQASQGRSLGGFLS